MNLKNNLIYDIQKGAFTNMTRMVRLILTRNKISRIDDNVLSGKTFWPTFAGMILISIETLQASKSSNVKILFKEKVLTKDHGTFLL